MSGSPKGIPPASPSTERVDERFAGLDTWSLGQSLRALVEGQRRSIDAVEAALASLEAAAAGIEARLRSGGRLCYAGAGTSGRLAVQDAAELPPTFGFERAVVLMAGGAAATGAAKEGAEDDVQAAIDAVAEHGIGAGDALIGIAASGRTPFTVAAVRAARGAGAFTVGIANSADSELLRVAEVPVHLDTGPEVLAGSTRLSAGTAQKAALNLLSTSVLVRLGGAYGNLMVGMRATNDKLKRRAVAMVSRVAGVDEASATEALREAGGDVRTALVMRLAGVEAAAAQAALGAHGQRVRDALAALGHGEG